jgi:hypothetical protein
MFLLSLIIVLLVSIFSYLGGVVLWILLTLIIYFAKQRDTLNTLVGGLIGLIIGYIINILI